MSFHEWLEDARAFETLLAPETEVCQRVHHLVGEVAARGSIGSTRDLLFIKNDEPLKEHVNRFVVVEAPPVDDIDPRSPFFLGMASGRLIEGIVEQPDLSYLVLPNYDHAQRLGNGFILLHALEHLTEMDTDFPKLGTLDPVIRAGKQEKRAYALNEAVLNGIDAAGFNDYIDSLPYSLTVTPASDGLHHFNPTDAELSRTIAPPKET